MNIDERIEAITMNLELASRDIEKHGQQIAVLAKVAEDCLASIRSLENIARSHEQRLDDLEG